MRLGCSCVHQQGLCPGKARADAPTTGCAPTAQQGRCAMKYVWQCPSLTVAVSIVLEHRFFCRMITHDDTYKVAPTMSVKQRICFQVAPLQWVCYTRQAREERTLPRTLQPCRALPLQEVFCSTSPKLALLCRNTWPLQWFNQATDGCRAHTGAPSPDTGHQQIATP